MQTDSTKNWTWVAVSISKDDNHYTTGASLSLSLSLSYMNMSENTMEYMNVLWSNFIESCFIYKLVMK